MAITFEYSDSLSPEWGLDHFVFQNSRSVPRLHIRITTHRTPIGKEPAEMGARLLYSIKAPLVLLLTSQSMLRTTTALKYSQVLTYLLIWCVSSGWKFGCLHNMV